MRPQTQPSSPPSRTEQVRRNVQALIAGIRSGHAEEVYRRFYSPQARYIETWQREYPRAIPGVEVQGAIAGRLQVHEATAVRVLVEDDTNMIEWRVLVSATRGVRKDEVIPVRQIWIQTWSGDRIVEEEYYAP